MKLGELKKSKWHWSTRIIMHIAIGVVTVLLARDNPYDDMHWVVGVVIAVLFYLGFLVYELEECFHLKDGAWIDISGSMIGLAGLYLYFKWLPIVVAWMVGRGL